MEAPWAKTSQNQEGAFLPTKKSPRSRIEAVPDPHILL